MKLKKIAAIISVGMAYNRQVYADRLQEAISGAAVEFYKATLAKKNGKTKWVSHWMYEVDRLLGNQLYFVISHEIKGFKDRKKVIDALILKLRRTYDKGFQNRATNKIKRDFDLPRLKYELDNDDSDKFWMKVQESIDEALEDFK